MSGLVWLDYTPGKGGAVKSYNGIRDSGERSVAGVTIHLYLSDSRGNSVGNPIKEMHTDLHGTYQFFGLRPNTHYVVKADNWMDYATGGPLAGDRLTLFHQGHDPASDSDAILVGNAPTISDAQTGGPGSDTEGYDFGFYPCKDCGMASLGGVVWLDRNGNGVRGSSEPPIVGVTVSRYNTTGYEIGHTTTNGQGQYHFLYLAPDTEYLVKLDNMSDFSDRGPLAGGQLTRLHRGNDPARESDAILIGKIPTIPQASTGASGIDTEGYDFGFIPPCKGMDCRGGK